MARLKKTVSKDIDKAQTRFAGMNSIVADLDLGEGVTAKNLQSKIKAANDAIDAYNATLSLADNQLNAVNQSIREMNDLSERAFTGVKFKYGADSSEYEMLGGTRKSERKKPIRKAKTPTP